jgi:hypothetical protein
MRRSIASAWITIWMINATLACLATGCLSGGYEEDFQARLQQYKREAAGDPPAANPAANAAAPAAAGEAD